jgi:hypothetical protein
VGGVCVCGLCFGWRREGKRREGKRRAPCLGWRREGTRREERDVVVVVVVVVVMPEPSLTPNRTIPSPPHLTSHHGPCRNDADGPRPTNNTIYAHPSIPPASSSTPDSSTPQHCCIHPPFIPCPRGATERLADGPQPTNNTIYAHPSIPPPSSSTPDSSTPQRPSSHAPAALQKDWPIYEMGAERAVAQLNSWLDRIHVSLNDDLVPYIMDSMKVGRSVCLSV